MYKLFASVLLSASITTSVSAEENESTSISQSENEITLVQSLFNNQACTHYPDCLVEEAAAMKLEEEQQEESYSTPEPIEGEQSQSSSE